MNKFQYALDLLFSRAFPNFKDGDSNKYKSHMLLQELVDKHEKYKWHDLRKDPNDLPINLLGETVLVCQKTSWGTNDYSLCYYDKKGFNYYDSEYGDIVLDNVTAWKYIEEFEDE